MFESQPPSKNGLNRPLCRGISLGESDDSRSWSDSAVSFWELVNAGSVFTSIDCGFVNSDIIISIATAIPTPRMMKNIMYWNREKKCWIFAPTALISKPLDGDLGGCCFLATRSTSTLLNIHADSQICNINVSGIDTGRGKFKLINVHFEVVVFNFVHQV